jgi:hypothetical protein
MESCKGWAHGRKKLFSQGLNFANFIRENCTQDVNLSPFLGHNGDKFFFVGRKRNVTKKLDLFALVGLHSFGSQK